MSYLDCCDRYPSETALTSSPKPDIVAQPAINAAMYTKAINNSHCAGRNRWRSISATRLRAYRKARTYSRRTARSFARPTESRSEATSPFQSANVLMIKSPKKVNKTRAISASAETHFNKKENEVSGQTGIAHYTDCERT